MIFYLYDKNNYQTDKIWKEEMPKKYVYIVI